MHITNFKKLIKTDLREKALLIAEAGYDAIDIKKSVKRRISVKNGILEVKMHTEAGTVIVDLKDYKRVFVVGVGKGSALASMTLAKTLGKYLTKGIALDVSQPKLNPPAGGQKLKIFKGDHPLPSKQNIKATQEIIEIAGKLNEHDLLISFICGGGSALACSKECELTDSVLVIKELTKKGANISELNTVRKHLSDFKGGGLAKIAYPATVVSLIVSDVCGNDLSTVSSGPTVFDKTSKKDAENILKKYSLKPLSVSLVETPKDQKYFKKVQNILFVCNQDAALVMIEKSREFGFNSRIQSLALEGEAKCIFSPMINKIKNKEAIIAAGETTITFVKNGIGIMENGKAKIGKGGRNQEAVLGVVNNLRRSAPNSASFCVISFASDAYDHTESAGAIGDILTVQEANKLNLDIDEYLKTHSTFEFFEKTGDALYAQKTCFNVADLMLVIKD